MLFRSTTLLPSLPSARHTRGREREARQRDLRRLGVEYADDSDFGIQ